MSNILFVYGTLKQGYGNHDRLLRGSKFLGRAYSKDDFLLYSNGIPFLIDCAPDWHGSKIIGELYSVTDEVLSYCDRLEGHPQMYCREEREFIRYRDPRKPVKAWVYLYQHPERFMRDGSKDERIHVHTDNMVEWS